jgi:hypothetical protein
VVTRPELVLIFVGLFALAMVGLWRGWMQRAKRQESLPELPQPPADLGADLVPELTGLYVGTTVSRSWQDRIVAQRLGERADSVARLTAAGALIERSGSTPVFIPIEQLTDARLEPALAGKVVGQGGLLVLSWRHGGHHLDTGLRADDKTRYPAWVRAVEGRCQ